MLDWVASLHAINLRVNEQISNIELKSPKSTRRAISKSPQGKAAHRTPTTFKFLPTCLSKRGCARDCASSPTSRPFIMTGRRRLALQGRLGDLQGRLGDLRKRPLPLTTTKNRRASAPCRAP